MRVRHRADVIMVRIPNGTVDVQENQELINRGLQFFLRIVPDYWREKGMNVNFLMLDQKEWKDYRLGLSLRNMNLI